MSPKKAEALAKKKAKENDEVMIIYRRRDEYTGRMTNAQGVISYSGYCEPGAWVDESQYLCSVSYEPADPDGAYPEHWQFETEGGWWREDANGNPVS